jgi:hypothetical protein
MDLPFLGKDEFQSLILFTFSPIKWYNGKTCQRHKYKENRLMKKKIAPAIVFALLISQFSFSQTIASFAADETAAATVSDSSEAQNCADKLNSLGLFKGTDKGYELGRTPTRTEAIVMLIRLLGEDTIATSQKYGHPFSDVPSWANNYVGYAYEKGLTKGLTSTAFGANSSATSAQYLTFILRALGYSESAGDFTYAHAIDKAVEIGLVQLIERQKMMKSFSRGDSAILSFRALESGLKGTETGDFATACTDWAKWDDTLIHSLINKGAVNKDDAVKAGLLFMEDVAPAPFWMHYSATSDRTQNTTEDLINFSIVTDNEVTETQTYIRINAGDWMRIQDCRFEDGRITLGHIFRSANGRMKGFRNAFWASNLTDAMVDLMVTVNISGKEYRSMVYSYKTAPEGIYLRGFRGSGEDWGPSGGLDGESQAEQYLRAGTEGNNDNHIWKWYESDSLEGPYKLVEGADTYHYGYDGDQMFPIQQGKYFYYSATSAPDSTLHNGWIINGPYYYK